MRTWPALLIYLGGVFITESLMVAQGICLWAGKPGLPGYHALLFLASIFLPVSVGIIWVMKKGGKADAAHSFQLQR
jgi:hypothetical protein